MKRVATISIFIEKKDSVTRVNEILINHSELIISRMGIPYRERRISVIVLILDAENDRIGGLAGKLGNIEGVSVKTAMKK